MICRTRANASSLRLGRVFLGLSGAAPKNVTAGAAPVTIFGSAKTPRPHAPTRGYQRSTNENGQERGSLLAVKVPRTPALRAAEPYSCSFSYMISPDSDDEPKIANLPLPS